MIIIIYQDLTNFSNFQEGLLTFEENVPNVKTCWKHCNYYENCAWYSYEREAGLCFLLENCANPIPGEEEFVSGEAAPNCNEDDFAYEWWL